MSTASGLLLIILAAAPGSASQRIRFGPGVCGPIDPAYIKGATETGGQPFPLSTAEVGAMSQVIAIDPSVRRVMFSGTFDGTGGSATLIAPDGSRVQAGERIRDTPLNCGRITTVEAPANGTWQLRMVPSRHFWLVVKAQSDLSMDDVAFVEPREGPEGNHFVEIQGEPIAGRPATLRARVSSTLRDPAFELVTAAAQRIQPLDLRASDDHEFTGTITLPDGGFRVMATGVDESGARVQRISPRTFSAEPIEVVPPPGDTVPAGVTPIAFTIRNHGPAVHLTLVSSDHRGTVIPVDPPALDLDAGAQASVVVQLTVPGDAAPGSEASVRLTATIDPKAALGSYNSAAKTFTVSPRQADAFTSRGSPLPSGSTGLLSARVR